MSGPKLRKTPLFAQRFFILTYIRTPLTIRLLILLSFFHLWLTIQNVLDNSLLRDIDMDHNASFTDRSCSFEGMWNEESPSPGIQDSPINQLARLARFNRVSPKYELMDEKGPAHRKVFIMKVSYILNGALEEFTGEGSSIKSASHNAALAGIQLSKNLRHPPQKCQPDKQLFVNKPPVAQLNSLAVKMRSWADYKDLCQLNPFGLPVWSTTVHVCGRVFYGLGHSKVISRNNAAFNAVEFFERGKHSRTNASASLLEEVIPEVSKGAINLIYETASRCGQELVFELVSSEGPPHSQIHKVKGVMGDIEAYGQGASKKVAKQAAAEKLLEKIRESEKLRIDLPPKKPKMNPTKVAKARPDYGKNINPVSRLYQLQQARNAPDPVFEVSPVEPIVSGVCKDFVAIVKVSGCDPVSAVGSSKKLAKRFAAENFLRNSGYHQQPSANQKSNLRIQEGEAVVESEKSDRRVKFDLDNPESEDKQNGRTYRRRFVKYPRPTTSYPNESIRETIVDAASIEPKTDPCSPTSSDSSSSAATFSVSVISTIAKELLSGSSSPTAAGIFGRTLLDVCPGDGEGHLAGLKYLCRIANITLTRETFAKQGPHAEYVTILTVGEPIESIGCGGGATEEIAISDAARNLLNVISEQGDVREICAESNRLLSSSRKTEDSVSTGESTACDLSTP